jgi:CheY-like chemotaxis protein
MAKILWFDDDVNEFNNPIKEFLQGFHKHRVDIVSTLKEVENKIATEIFNLLLLDIRINPKNREGMREYYRDDWTRTGVKLIERIRNGKIGNSTLSTIPIIVLTAVVHPQTLEMINTIGKKNKSFIHIIQKPPRLADLAGTIENALQRTKV